MSAMNSTNKKVNLRKPWQKKRDPGQSSVVGESDSQYNVLHMVEELAKDENI